uniref:SNF2 N-terminal domain-containing protein n=1 Tax=viral metagenome TaxID=1070528 RepID=A0A6C0EWU8_9ZZZZ
MDPDPSKKQDQKPKKPSIQINKINIPEHLRNKLNPKQATGQGAGVHLGANVGQAGLAGATSLSTMDPFIKVVADSNRGIILMPVLSDVTFSIPSSSSIKSMLPDSSSASSQGKSIPSRVPSDQPVINTSKTPNISTGQSRSLSFPNFSNLSNAPFSASGSQLRSERNAFGNVLPSSDTSSSSTSKRKEFNISFPVSLAGEKKIDIGSGINISILPKDSSSIGSSSSSSSSANASREGFVSSEIPPQGSSIAAAAPLSDISIGREDLSRAPSSEVEAAAAAVAEAEAKARSLQYGLPPPSPSPSPPSSSSTVTAQTAQTSSSSIKGLRGESDVSSESKFQEDLQERFLANMSPEQQKEFVFNPDMSKKSKKQQNSFLKEKGEAERQSIDHFNQHFSKLSAMGSSPSPPLSPSEELEAQSDENAYNFLYPTLDDPEFNIKIASKREFADTRYDGAVLDSLEAIKRHSDKMCNADFELSPHQLFVRNFLSFQTPYNSLLLYHGLGTGKTCSAITICEEMRDYLTQIGMSTSQKIIIVASPNVQQNFKLQLFDKNKLKLIDGIWNIRSCTGNKFLKEMNPMNMKGMEEEKVVSEIKKIIRRSYRFLGYDQFANLIEKTSTISDEIIDKSHRTKIMMQKLKIVFGNSLIVIDEFHNIKSTDEKSGTRAVADQLEKLVKFGPFLMTRLLLLTGTPMYNSYREIIWLLNIMRLNDGRAMIDIRDVFNSNPDEGIFVETNEGEGEEGRRRRGQIIETGRENLRRFSTGYVSYIRGENPYTFPFRIYPDEFAPEHTFSGLIGVEAGSRSGKKLEYEIPTMQINGRQIPEHRALSRMQDKIYLTEASEYQQNVYSYIIRHFLTLKRDEMRNIEESVSVGINILRSPIEALNISYPSDDFDPVSENPNYDIRLLVGKYGLRNIMNYNEDTKTNFEYKADKPHIFSRELIGNYSSKIKNICDNIYKSDGIILIYSFYIEGGVIPMALALESMGFTRYGTKAKPLFNNPPDGVRPIDGITSRKRTEMHQNETFFPAKYVVISGEAALSPDNIGDVKAASNEANFDGRFVKVIIISKSGTEGLDFKNIRQTHILEPWYNINLIEQTIGRAVRNCSHKNLEFEKRNVQIFLHGSILSATPTQEAADIYMYRLSERKARYIGEVSRVLKENAVDCLLNIEQTNFTEEKFDEKLHDEPVTQILSSYNPETQTNISVQYKIGDKNYSSVCDYMECVFSCKPSMNEGRIGSRKDIFTDTILTMNTDKIIQRIRDIFQERFFYKRTTSGKRIQDISSDLIATINYNKKYPIEAIDVALTQLLEDKNEFIRDKYGRYGRLANIGSYYLFQPLELNNPIIPLRDRQKPVDFKREKIIFKPSKEKNYFEEFKKSYISSIQQSRSAAAASAAQSKKPRAPLSVVEEVEEEEEAAQTISSRVGDIGKKRESEGEGEGEGEGESEDELFKYFSTFKKEPKSLTKVRKLFKDALDKKEEHKYRRGNNDWYYNCGNILRKKLSFIPSDLIQKLVVSHILEELNIEETLSILNYIISPKRREYIMDRRDKPEKYILDELMEEYYENNILHSRNGMEAILLINLDGTYQLFLKDTNINIWKPAGPADIEYFKTDISAKNAVTQDIPLNDYIGFITSINSKKKDFSSLIFKTKRINVGKGTGKGRGKLFGSSIATRCDQAGRATTEKNLKNMLQPPKINEIIDALPESIKESYLNYGIEKRTGEGGEVIPLTDELLLQFFINRIALDNSKEFSVANKRDTNEIELCILQEFILRYFDVIQKDDRRWFLTPIQVLLNKIETLR